MSEKLTIASDEREFKFSLGDGWSKRSLSLREERGLLEVEQRLTEGLYPSPFRAPGGRSEDLQQLGTFLGQLLPADIRERLDQATELILEAGRTPWELAWWNGHHLWERLAVGRTLGKPRRGTPKEVPPSLLAVADPDGLLPHSREQVKRLLTPLGETVRVLTGATRKQLESEFHKGHGVAHLCAYPAQDGLCVADGIWKPSSPSKRHSVPRLVFLDLAAGPGPLLERGLQWIERFADLGVEAVIVTAWEGNPERMAALVGSFYALLQSGRSWGQALRAARLQQLSEADPWLTAHGLLAYGEPSLAWNELKPLRVQPADAQTTLRQGWACDLVLQVTAGPEKGRQIALFFKALRQGSLVIGSSGPRDCDIELEDAEIENQAARLVLEDEHLWMIALGSGLRVNGLPVSERIRLAGDELLEMGATAIRLTRPGGQGSQPPEDLPEAGRFALELNGARHALARPVELLGRSSDCTLALDDAAVSRRHATVTWRQHGYCVGPVGASPVAVNGVSIDSERALRHGDNIQLSAGTLLRFVDLRK